MAATLSESDDGESSSEDEAQIDEKFLAFAANQEKCEDLSSIDSEYDLDEQQEAYDKMYKQWLTMLKKVQSLEREKAELVKDKKALTKKVNFLANEVSNKEGMYMGVINELAEAKVF